MNGHNHRIFRAGGGEKSDVYENVCRLGDKYCSGVVEANRVEASKVSDYGAEDTKPVQMDYATKLLKQRIKM